MLRKDGIRAAADGLLALEYFSGLVTRYGGDYDVRTFPGVSSSIGPWRSPN